jgi:hypothetical protein
MCYLARRGGYQLEELFRTPQNPLSRGSIELLFNFILSGTEELLKKGTKSKAGAVFLLSVHFRLYYLSMYYHHPKAEAYRVQLFAHWKLLLDEGKNNPGLARELGQAVFAALPVIESMDKVDSDPDFAEMLASTLLLECTSEISTKLRYNEMIQNYGYRSFQTILSRHSDSDAIWRKAAAFVLGVKINTCDWDVGKGTLKIDDLVVDLYARSTANEDAGSRLLPQVIARLYHFTEIFEDKQPLCHVRQEGQQSIYSFRHKREDYEIHCNREEHSRIQIYKKIDGHFCALMLSNLNLDRNNSFIKEIFLWGNPEKIYLENKRSGKLMALGDAKGIHRFRKGKVSNEVLGKFKDQNDPLRVLFERFESSSHTLVWCDSDTALIKHIELSRLGLKFVAANRQGKAALVCSKYPGYFVSQHQHIDFLKNYRGYLVLENDNGQKKVLVQAQEISVRKYEPYECGPLAHMTEAFPVGPLIVYDLDTNQQEPELTPSPSKTPDILMLIYVYLSTKQYQRALNLLKKTSITDKKHLDLMSVEILKWIVHFDPYKSFRDVHPHAVALRMHMYAWQVCLGQKLHRDVRDDVTLYNDLYHSLDSFKISSEDLAQISDILSDINYKVQPAYGIINFEIACPRAIGLWPLREKISACASKPPKPFSSFAMPGEDFILNFLPYYAIALKGSQTEKLALKRILAAAASEEEMPICILRNVLVKALEEPEEVPSVEQIQEIFQNPQSKEDFGRKIVELSNLKKPLYRISSWCFEKGEGLVSFNISEEHKKVIYPASTIPHAPFKPMPALQIAAPKKIYGVKEIDGDILEDRDCPVTEQMQSADKLQKWAESQAEALKAHRLLPLNSNGLQKG